MVELRLEAVEATLPKDCYVSVRIGEVQKLSRLAASRSFKFPPNLKNRFGKIEIFRRIGAASVDLDPEISGERDVSININDIGTECVDLRVGVGPSNTDPKAMMETPPSPQADKASSKARAAKEYLQKHSLEVRLSEAMQAVLRERPDDPLQFLASRLNRESVKAAAKVATRDLPAFSPKAAGPVPPSQPANMKPFGPYYKATFLSVPAAGFAKMYSRYPAPSKRGPVFAVKSAKPALTPFGKYYATNFDSLPASNMQKAYARFPAYQESLVKASSAKVPVARDLRRSQTVREISARRLLVALEAALPNADLVCRGPVIMCGSTPLASIQLEQTGQITVVWNGAEATRLQVDRPAVLERFRAATDQAAAPKPSASPSALAPPNPFLSAKAKAFAKMPSAGTWLMVKPPAFVENLAAKAAAPKKFNMRPSVGTWLMMAPKLAPVAAVVQESPKKFNMRPSVGTWLMMAPKPAQAASLAQDAVKKPFQFRPSVGTWLVRQLEPVKVAAPAPAAPKQNFALMPSVATWSAARRPALQRPRISAVRRLKHLQEGKVTSDQRCEAERVLTKALLEMAGEFEGEYYPLMSSNSWPLTPGGMSWDEEELLKSRSLLFSANGGGASGRGVFVNTAQDVAAWVNEDDRVRFIVFRTGPSADDALLRFQQAVAGALHQDGYTLL